MENDVKIIAFYLPQFHEIPENSKWWGKDFTEWVNVKKAKPLFEGHVQPKIPLNNRYYSLLDKSTQIWQSDLAKKYGVYGFCYYHYWFTGKMLLEKPMEMLLQNPKADLPFCICWANDPWTKGWIGQPNIVLMEQSYGSKDDWEKHYEYLEQFFKDKRYIKINNKPLFVLYKPQDIPDCDKMMDCWIELSKKSGFDGMVFAYQTITMDITNTNSVLREKFDYDIEFEPSYGLYDYRINDHAFLRKIKRWIESKVERVIAENLHINISSLFDLQSSVMRVDYGEVWEKIINRKPLRYNSIPGAFARWDNTPRRGKKGIVYTNNKPNIFEHYLTIQLKRCKEEYKSDMLFIYAWNEWAEGGYLEPDVEFGYEYLEAIKNAKQKAKQ